MLKAVQGYTGMHKGVQGCASSPWQQGAGQSAAVLPAPQRGSVPLWDDLQLWNLVWLPCTHHGQGMFRSAPGLKIISLGTLGKKEVISVAALPKHLSPCTALARLLLLRISHCQEGLLRTSSMLFVSPLPRHSLSSGAAATAPSFSMAPGRGGRWRPRYCRRSTHTPGHSAPSSRQPSAFLPLRITHQSCSGLQMGWSCFSSIEVLGEQQHRAVLPWDHHYCTSVQGCRPKSRSHFSCSRASFLFLLKCPIRSLPTRTACLPVPIRPAGPSQPPVATGVCTVPSRRGGTKAPPCEMLSLDVATPTLLQTWDPTWGMHWGVCSPHEVRARVVPSLALMTHPITVPCSHCGCHLPTPGPSVPISITVCTGAPRMVGGW